MKLEKRRPKKQKEKRSLKDLQTKRLKAQDMETIKGSAMVVTRRTGSTLE